MMTKTSTTTMSSSTTTQSKTPTFPASLAMAVFSFLFLLTVFPANTFVSGEPVNVALNRPVTALYTCGTFGEESYNTLQDADKSYEERQRLTCMDLRANGNPDVVKTPTHAPAKMVDGNLETIWQSTSRNRRYFYGDELEPEQNKLLEARINIDLQQEFLAEKILIQLGEALSPQKIEILKSLDGQSYSPWIYAVSITTYCGNFFDTTFGNIPLDENATVCLGYSADRFPPGDSIELDISNIPDVLKEWTRIRYLQVKFFDMLFAYPYNQIANTFNHYAIRELQVMAECPCNGQQTDCQPSPSTGQYECVCGGNTKGRFCESCLTMYNQFQFQRGVACQECNCFQHATSCYYRPTVEQNQESIDKDGNKNGGGVCLDCQHNTAGINCDKCASMYYRPVGVLQTAENACVSCGCSLAGSTINPSTGVADCVMNDDETRTDDKVPGECFCKANVEGTQCDTCKSGFYKIDQSHDEGCIECACFTSGTVDGSAICVGDQTGQCPCKGNVQGRECDQCKDGFYGLSDENAEGCIPCDCDIGGSVHQNCDKGSGQCVCRSSNIGGRTCNSVKTEFFYPGAHAIHDEFEGSFGLLKSKSDQRYSGFSGEGYAAPNVKDDLSVLLTVPDTDRLSGQFILVIVYQSPIGESLGGNVDIDIVSQPDQTPASVILPVCSGRWCQADTGVGNLQELWAGANIISVNVTSGNVLLDKIVAVPIEYTKADGLLSITLPPACDFLKDTMPDTDPDQATCKQALFSVTMYYWQSGLPCNCDVTGSVNSVCDPNGGQCVCREGVIGRQCDKCAADHFGFSSSGCTPCDCDSLTSSCDPVTGQCECPDNTFGRQCELCLPGSWGWEKTAGCKDCNCHPDGAAFTKCNDTIGACTCKPGVKGDKCDECEDNFYNLNSMGCSPCACNAGGASSTICDKTTGQCDCKANTAGRQCDECLTGTYGLADGNPDGCLTCVCMGVTGQCTSSDMTFSNEPFALSKTSENGTIPTLQVTTADGSDVTKVIQVETNADQVLTSTLIVSNEAGQPPVYWKMPDVLVTNLLGLYGTRVTVAANYINVDGQAVTALTAIILTTDGRTVKADFGQVGEGFGGEVSVSVREGSWKLDGSAVPLTRQEFLKVLSRGSAMLIPATYSTGKHTARLSRLQFNVPNENGVINPAVEKCECGSSYSGSSCERCAEGFKRTLTNLTEFFGECATCQCNGHSSVCDEDTSQCLDCQDNTVGNSCEECALGYYGDATGGTSGDCLPCPCFQPRVVDAACRAVDVNGTRTVQCDNCRDGYVGDICNQCTDAYYGNPGESGGTCTACDCNGNADVCDSVTGVCQDCQHNTVGENCDRCLDTFYGDASAQGCTACACLETSSDSLVCEGQTGQCPCVAGVGGQTCDQCLDEHWGFANDTFVGCKPCFCNAAGSVSTQCASDNGDCTCSPNTEGDLCDTCSANFFGLPDAPCQACDCDATGTIPDTTCDFSLGQCSCQPGVGGRRCDQCLPLFVNFTSTGCVECDQCPRALGTSVEQLNEEVTSYINKAKVVSEVQVEDTRLQNLTTQLDASLEQVGLTGSDATSVTDVLNNITSMKTGLEQSFTTTNTVNGNTNVVTKLSADASELTTKSGSEAAEQLGMLTSVTDINSRLTVFERGLTTDLQTLVQYNSSASKLAEQGKGAGTITLDLSSDIAAANEVLTQVQAIGSEVDAVTLTVNSQAIQTTSQSDSLQTLRGQFDEASLLVDDLTSDLNTVSFDVGVTESTLDDSMTYKSQAEELLTAVQSILDDAETGNDELTSTLASAQSAVSNANTIYSGDARSLMQGEDIFFPSGVTNYENGKQRLEVLISAITLLVDQTSSSVTAAEDHVNTLQQGLESLNSTFKDLPAIGNEANAAIKNYELVIEDLDKSVEMADTASGLITQVQNDLSGDALETLRASYDQEKLTSEAFRDELVQLDYKPQVLESTISSHRSQLVKETEDWQQTDVKMEQMNAASHGLAGKLADNQLLSQLTAAQEKVTDAATTSENVAASVTSQSKVLDQKETELDTTKAQIGQVNELDTQVRSDLNAHLTAFSALETKLSDAASARDTGLASTQSISDKIKLLEAKLAKAEGLLERLRQPRTFDGSLSLQIDNPKVDTTSNANSLSLNLRKAAGFSDGNIFFTENDGNDDEFEVGMASNQVFLEFSTGGGKVKVTNPMEICDDCWAKVVASRLGNVGYLSVTSLTDGQVTSSSGSGQPQSTASTMTLTTPLYLGSLPEDTNIVKVINKRFEGCLMDVNFESQAINLWSAAVSTNQEAKCCQAPPTSSPTTLAEGVSLSGFGYLVIDNPIFSNFETFSFEFRTFSSTGTIFYAASEDSQSSFSIGLAEGSVVYKTRVGGSDASLQTDNAYNTGKWVKVSLRVVSGQMEFSANFLDALGSIETKTGPIVDLSFLSGRNIIIGASSDPFTSGATAEQAAATLSTDVDDSYFSGCLRSVSHKQQSVSEQEVVSLSENVVIKDGVIDGGCFQDVMKGLQFLTESSYGQLTSGTDLSAITSIQMEFTTSHDQGVLLYIQATGTTRYLYVGIFGGHVLLKYQQENSKMVISDQMYISDGQAHSLDIDMTTSRVTMRVDERYFEDSSATLTSAQLTFTADTALFLGGKQSLSSEEFPAVTSFMGGVASFTLNGNPVTLTQSTFDTWNDVSLAGLSQPSPVAESRDDCVTPTAPALLPVELGILLDGSSSISWSDLVDPLASLFNSIFTLEFDFAAYKSDGVLLYVANDLVSPTVFYLIYMEGGRINLKMKTSIGILRGAQLSGRYNTGQRFQLTASRENDFGTLVIGSEDAANTGAPETVTSFLDFPMSVGVYVAGIGNYERVGSPLPAGFQQDESKLNFAGALRSVRLTVNGEQKMLPFSSLDRSTYPAVPQSVTFGLSLTGQSSYLGLGPITTTQQTSMEFKMATSTESALVFAVYEGAKYILGVYSQQQISLHLSPSFPGLTGPITIPVFTLAGGAVLCDDQSHTISVQLTANQAVVTVDGVTLTSTIPSSHVVQTFQAGSFVVGGLPADAPSFGDVITTNMAGCVESVKLTTGAGVTNYDPTQYGATSQGISYGCPV